MARNGFSSQRLRHSSTISGRDFPLPAGSGSVRSSCISRGSLLCMGWASLGAFLGIVLHRPTAEASLGDAYLSWLLISLPYSVFMYFTVLGSVYAFTYFIEARDRESQAARLAAQLSEARLSALRMQLNPHFLFNGLNALLVLVRERKTADAARMLELLSDLLRQVLNSDRTHYAPLSREAQVHRAMPRGRADKISGPSSREVVDR